MNSIQEQAIKIEQLEDQKAKAYNATFLEILSASREVDSVTYEIYKLGEKRKMLYGRLTELREKQKRDEAHYDLLIRAQQAINANLKSSENAKE